MARTVGIRIHVFAEIIENNCFYVDKSSFIREWWENRDKVTLITRPRRFGKTLNMSMLDYFFPSNTQAGEICLRGWIYGKKKSSVICRARWFEGSSAFNEFTSAMFRGDVRSMNHYMNKVALDTFSYFDTGKKPSEKKEPERFYHGFEGGRCLIRKA